MKNIGKAYAIFDCSASKEEIEAQLPSIREDMKTPPTLTLCLTEGIENLECDDSLKHVIKEKKLDGLRFVLEANDSRATNVKTAGELVAIQNEAYQLPLYEDINGHKEPYYGEVIYRGRGGKYHFME
jgi:hypothetical protein